MNKARWIGGLVLAAVLLPLAPVPAGAAGCEDGGCWRLRLGWNRIDGDDEEIAITDVLADGSEERRKFAVGGGGGPAASLEYLFNERVGLEVGLCLDDLDALGVFDTATDWAMTTKDLGVTTFTVGPNFHLTPGRKVDFYIGPFLALSSFDSVDYSLLGRQLRADVDDAEGLGAQVGVDIPLGESAWAINLAARYLEMDADVRDSFPGSLTLGGLKGLVGIVWTSGGRGPKMADEPEPPPPPPPEPEPEPEPEPVKPERRETCTFGFGSMRVDNICKARLDEIGLSMVQDPSLVAHVVGHSDSRGSDSANMRLSVNRAEAVKSYLVERYGIDASRITTEGRGSSEPVASNETASGRDQNRRAEIVVKSQ